MTFGEAKDRRAHSTPQITNPDGFLDAVDNATDDEAQVAMETDDTSQVGLAL